MMKIPYVFASLVNFISLEFKSQNLLLFFKIITAGLTYLLLLLLLLVLSFHIKRVSC